MAINRDGNKEEALKRAFRFLAYRARSEAEVRAKLTQWGFPEKSIKGALKRLRSLSVLNDEDFARGWTLARAKARGYGPRRIESQLLQKGISKSLIRLILQEAFDEQGEKRRARELLEKNFKGKDLSNVRVLRRAGDFLHRRGYHASVITELLGQALTDD